MSRCLRGVPGLALVAALVLPCAAQAAQKDVSLGPPVSAQKALQKTGSDVNDFFPHKVTIHVGDTVRFVPSGFHTVDLPGSRTKKLPVISPLGTPITGSVDAAGAAFWFNGQSQVGFTPSLLKSSFGKRKSYSGASAVDSGLPLARRPKPMSVRFTRTGTFRYFCDVHYRMTGIVRVVGSSRPVPSARADRATLAAQVRTTLATAKAIAKTKAPPANTVDVGEEGKGNVSLFAFNPASLTVPVGTTVTFRMRARTEVHTATIGPGDPAKESPPTYLSQIEAGLQGAVFDPRGVFPSDAPGALAALTAASHGNGFWNSGALDEDPATATVPPSSAVQFAGPGVYQVYCMIHPFMHGTITVQ
jgi:plastocyanin